jgi:hypothetical protein
VSLSQPSRVILVEPVRAQPKPAEKPEPAAAKP